MMYEDIRSACSEYHSGSRAYDEEYNSYMLDKDWPKWNQGTLDLAEAGKLIAFLNLWDTPMPVRLIDLLPQLQFVAKGNTVVVLRTILDVNFDDVAVEQLTVNQLIQICFNKLANCKTRVQFDGSFQNPSYHQPWTICDVGSQDQKEVWTHEG